MQWFPSRRTFTPATVWLTFWDGLEVFLLQDHHARGRLEGAEAERHERDESTPEVCEQYTHVCRYRSHNVLGRIFTMTQENRSIRFRPVVPPRYLCSRRVASDSQVVVRCRHHQWWHHHSVSWAWYTSTLPSTRSVKIYYNALRSCLG